MGLKLVAFMINDQQVTAPDEERWEPIEIGENLNGQQVRSSYWKLTWSKSVVHPCDAQDWLQFDGEILDSLTTRPQGTLDEVTRYTDVVCQQVQMRHERENVVQMVAEFQVGVS